MSVNYETEEEVRVPILTKVKKVAWLDSMYCTPSWINAYLDAGWILLAFYVTGDPTEGDQTPHARLGWIDGEREPVYPE